MDTLGKRIKSIRERLGWNQAKFAEKLNLQSPMAVSKYEKDQREPDISKLIIVAELGGVSLDWLLTGEEPKKEEVQSTTPFYTNEEQAYMERLVEVLRNPATKKAIQENIDTFLKVPKPAQEEEAPFVREKKGGTGP